MALLLKIQQVCVCMHVIVVDNESMYVDKINGNVITVLRGQDGTTAAGHVSGADVGTITSTDNDLIEVGDDFGFDGTIT